MYLHSSLSNFFSLVVHHKKTSNSSSSSSLKVCELSGRSTETNDPRYYFLRDFFTDSMEFVSAIRDTQPWFDDDDEEEEELECGEWRKSSDVKKGEGNIPLSIDLHAHPPEG